MLIGRRCARRCLITSRESTTWSLSELNAVLVRTLPKWVSIARPRRLHTVLREPWPISSWWRLRELTTKRESYGKTLQKLSRLRRVGSDCDREADCGVGID